MLTVKNFTYSYDGDGKRTKIVKNSTVQDTFIYDVNQELPQLLQDNNHKYVYGLDLVYTVGTTGNDVNDPFVYHADGLGSIQAISDKPSLGDPIVTDYSEYSSYGFEGSGSISVLTDQPFRFTGEQKDTVALNEELLNLRSRYYHPTIGRFMTRDPFTGSTTDPLTLNRYTYTNNNPINHTDPSGQWIDTVADIGFIAYDVYRLLTDDGKNQALREENLTSLKWNIVGAVIPGATGLGAASRVAKIVPYNQGKALTKGLKGERQAHHILEARHLKNWGLQTQDAPSVVLSRGEHQQVTNELRKALPFGGNYTRNEVWEKYQEIPTYQQNPEMLNAIAPYFGK